MANASRKASSESALFSNGEHNNQPDWLSKKNLVVCKSEPTSSRHVAKTSRDLVIRLTPKRQLTSILLELTSNFAPPYSHPGERAMTSLELAASLKIGAAAMPVLAGKYLRHDLSRFSPERRWSSPGFLRLAPMA